MLFLTLTFFLLQTLMVLTELYNLSEDVMLFLTLTFFLLQTLMGLTELSNLAEDVMLFLTLTFFLFLPTLVGTGGSYFFFSVLSPCTVRTVRLVMKLLAHVES